MPSQRDAIQADASAALSALEQASAQLAEALTAVQAGTPDALNQAFSEARTRLGQVVQALVKAVVLRQMQQYAEADASEEELRSLRNRQPMIEQTRLEALARDLARQ